jgi:hypothetical protein
MRFRKPRPATLTAAPNLVPDGDRTGTTIIAWSTGTGAIGQVFVSENGGLEQLFATGPAGRQATNVIAPGTQYEFRLYEGINRSARLASLIVTREMPAWDAISA